MDTVLTRFMRYIAVETTSNEQSFISPSTKGQLTLGAMLADEMKTMGLADVEQDEYGCVWGRIPATKGCETRPVLGFIAHMDTSDGAPGAPMHPRIVQYEGGDLPLGHGKVLSPAVFPSLERYIGQELIVTDGATLLGADDKAGVAEILTAAAELLAHPERPHGEIAVAFTPDEEIGRGADLFDVAGFGADFAYTVDGGAADEVEYENFRSE